MARYILIKLLTMIVVMWGVSLIVFFSIRLVPGDVLDYLFEKSSPEYLEQLRDQLGLNRPIVLQYFEWLGGVFKGDLGRSFITNRSIMGDLLDRFPITLELSGLAALWAVPVGITLGVLAGIRPYTFRDGAATLLSLLGMAIPSFWLATILILVFAVWLGWLPALGHIPFSRDPVGHFQSLILPAISLGMIMAAAVTRMTRSSMLEAMSQDYVRTARAKGLAGRTVVTRHALRNGLLPVTTIVGVEWAKLLAGSIIIEQIFAIPGVGQYAITSIFSRDYAALQGAVLFIAAVFVLTNLVVDIVYVILDPRVRYS